MIAVLATSAALVAVMALAALLTLCSGWRGTARWRRNRTDPPTRRGKL